MVVDFTRLNEACLDAFMESIACVFTTAASGAQPVTLIFSEPFTGIGIGNQMIDTPDTTVSAETEDVVVALIAVRDTVVIRGGVYTVTAIRPDTAGMTEMTLVKY
ncbi:MAG: hypothetical protein GY799_25400 [Desulfobulbaceae bacterium]|nr:hypothetical protein [Desulfobulbaceae bacterium]